MLTTTTKHAIVFEDCPRHIAYKLDERIIRDEFPEKCSVDFSLTKSDDYPTMKVIVMYDKDVSQDCLKDFYNAIVRYYDSILEMPLATYNREFNSNKEVKLYKDNDKFVVYNGKNVVGKFDTYVDANQHIYNVVFNSARLTKAYYDRY